MEHYFNGSAIGVVDRRGHVLLPQFIRTVLALRVASDIILFGRHEADPCLVGYGRSQVPQLSAELERRRLRDEAAGVDSARHHARLRRTFGLVTESTIDRSGRVMLPELERRRLGIESQILFVGTGAAFEVWDVRHACDPGRGDMAELARFRLEEVGHPVAA